MQGLTRLFLEGLSLGALKITQEDTAYKIP